MEDYTIIVASSKEAVAKLCKQRYKDLGGAGDRHMLQTSISSG